MERILSRVSWRSESVSKRYGNFEALRDVSFSVGSREIFGYIGPNGAGKTTTIKILVGLLTDFDGDVSFQGRSIRDNKMLINKELGYLPQNIGFQEWRTVDQALTTFGRLSGISANELDSRIASALDRVGIADLRYKKITQLSGGTMQKVGMAQAILHQPSVLVLDEPMAGLDPTARFEFKKIFQDLRKEGATILFSSHILNDVQDLADRIGFLSRGRLGYVGSMAEIEERLMVPKQIEVVLAAGSASLVGIRSVRRHRDDRAAGTGPLHRMPHAGGGPRPGDRCPDPGHAGERLQDTQDSSHRAHSRGHIHQLSGAGESMSLGLLFKDELRGFYKSKVMLTLWVGLPLLTLVIYFASPTSQNMSLASFTAIIIGSIGGVLAAAMLVASIISEKSRHVFDLFVIRPVKRSDIVLSKFLATYVCVTAAGVLALVFGAMFDLVRNGFLPGDLLSLSVNALIMAASMTAIACSAGVLIGFLANSMLTGIILVIYGANQLSVVAALPGLLLPNEPLLPLIPGVTVTAVLLVIAIKMFDRKQL